MQLSEEEIFAIACKEGDQEKHGFIFNKDGRWSVISFARALEAALRAQADARPCQYPNCGCDSRAKCTSNFNGAPKATEASAPGLVDQAIAICQEEGDEWDSDRVQATKNYAHACRDRIRALTRASAATTTPSSVRKALQYALSELGKPPFGGVVDCTPIVQALVDTGGIDMNASAANLIYASRAEQDRDAGR